MDAVKENYRSLRDAIQYGTQDVRTASSFSSYEELIEALTKNKRLTFDAGDVRYRFNFPISFQQKEVLVKLYGIPATNFNVIEEDEYELESFIGGDRDSNLSTLRSSLDGDDPEKTHGEFINSYLLGQYVKVFGKEYPLPQGKYDKDRLNMFLNDLKIVVDEMYKGNMDSQFNMKDERVFDRKGKLGYNPAEYRRLCERFGDADLITFNYTKKYFPQAIYDFKPIVSMIVNDSSIIDGNEVITFDEENYLKFFYNQIIYPHFDEEFKKAKIKSFIYFLIVTIAVFVIIIFSFYYRVKGEDREFGTLFTFSSIFQLINVVMLCVNTYIKWPDKIVLLEVALIVASIAGIGMYAYFYRQTSDPDEKIYYISMLMILGYTLIFTSMAIGHENGFVAGGWTGALLLLGLISSCAVSIYFANRLIKDESTLNIALFCTFTLLTVGCMIYLFRNFKDDVSSGASAVGRGANAVAKGASIANNSMKAYMKKRSSPPKEIKRRTLDTGEIANPTYNPDTSSDTSYESFPSIEKKSNILSHATLKYIGVAGLGMGVVGAIVALSIFREKKGLIVICTVAGVSGAGVMFYKLNAKYDYSGRIIQYYDKIKVKEKFATMLKGSLKGISQKLTSLRLSISEFNVYLSKLRNDFSKYLSESKKAALINLKDIPTLPSKFIDRIKKIIKKSEVRYLTKKIKAVGELLEYVQRFLSSLESRKESDKKVDDVVNKLRVLETRTNKLNVEKNELLKKLNDEKEKFLQIHRRYKFIEGSQNDFFNEYVSGNNQTSLRIKRKIAEYEKQVATLEKEKQDIEKKLRDLGAIDFNFEDEYTSLNDTIEDINTFKTLCGKIDSEYVRKIFSICLIARISSTGVSVGPPNGTPLTFRDNCLKLYDREGVQSRDLVGLSVGEIEIRNRFNVKCVQWKKTATIPINDDNVKTFESEYLRGTVLAELALPSLLNDLKGENIYDKMFDIALKIYDKDRDVERIFLPTKINEINQYLEKNNKRLHDISQASSLLEELRRTNKDIFEIRVELDKLRKLDIDKIIEQEISAYEKEIEDVEKEMDKTKQDIEQLSPLIQRKCDEINSISNQADELCKSIVDLPSLSINEKSQINRIIRLNKQISNNLVAERNLAERKKRRIEGNSSSEGFEMKAITR